VIGTGKALPLTDFALARQQARTAMATDIEKDVDLAQPVPNQK